MPLFSEDISFNGRLPKSIDGEAQELDEHLVRLPRDFVQKVQRSGLTVDEALQQLLQSLEDPGRWKVNVIARTINLKTGNVEEEVTSHNIVVDLGRQWHRDLLACDSFPATHTVEVPPSIVSLGDGYAVNQHRPRYIGVGVGGNKQTTTPPGPGALYEVVTIKGMERPALVTGTPAVSPIWMKQIDPQPVGSEDYYLDYYPSAYAIRFRTLFDTDEISYATQPTYGTNVPVSEFCLLSSRADRTVEPEHGTGTIDIPGVVAYTTTSTITKTPLNGLEVIWEFRT